MYRLERILGDALSESRFDIGRLESTQGHPLRSYAVRPEETVSVDHLRSIFDHRYQEPSDDNLARSAQLICPEGRISELRDHLQEMLEPHIEPESSQIGLALPLLAHSHGTGRMIFQPGGLLTLSSVTPLESFAKALVKGSALAGPERITSLVAGWAGGEPLRYRTCAILEGVSIDTPLELGEGVTTTLLPTASPELAKFMPVAAHARLAEYSGRTMVAIDMVASPALFRPLGDRQNDEVQVATSSNSNVELVLHALSLVSDADVGAKTCWNDYQEFADWFPSDLGIIWSETSGGPEYWGQINKVIRKDRRTGVITVWSDEAQEAEFKEAYLAGVLDALSKPNVARLRTATKRWVKSKTPADGLADQYIDLRIAMESLFLRNDPSQRNQEMRFRLALSGAWFLGTNLEDRKRVRRILVKAYDTASQAVHNGEIDDNAIHRKLLADAQNLCRQAILKMLEEGAPSDWLELVLGGVPSNS